jgi:hypothetical protein
VRGSWQRLRRAAKKDVETLLPNPLTITLSRRERGPEVTHFRIATQSLRIYVGRALPATAIFFFGGRCPPYVSISNPLQGRIPIASVPGRKPSEDGYDAVILG